MSNRETRLQIVVVSYLQTVLPFEAVFWAVLNERQGNAKQQQFYNLMGRRPEGSHVPPPNALPGPRGQNPGTNPPSRGHRGPSFPSPRGRPYGAGLTREE